MQNTEKQSIVQILPKLVVRLLVYSIMCFYIYKETGIVTALMIGLLQIELAIKTDYFDTVHEMVLRQVDILEDMLITHNEILTKQHEEVKKSTKNTK